MHRFRLVCLLAFCLWPVPASARPAFLQEFQRTFTPRPQTALAQAQCLTCHAQPGPPQRNPYGKEVELHQRQAHAAVVTAAVLRATVEHDSDADRWGNGDEIRAGTLPGDAASHPVGSTTPATPAAPSTPVPTPPLVPLHSFHPLIIHFPIALFVAGALLELVGARFGRDVLRRAGFVNVVLGSAAAFAAIATGAAALFRIGFPLSGLPLAHMCFALSATIGMATTTLLGRAAARADRPRGSAAYWAVLVVTLALVTVTGHLGATLVYG